MFTELATVCLEPARWLYIYILTIIIIKSAFSWKLFVSFHYEYKNTTNPIFHLNSIIKHYCLCIQVLKQMFIL